MTTSCPRCEYQVSEEFVFCPRCAKMIWPHLKNDFPRRFKRFAMILAVPAVVGCLVGFGVGQDPITAAAGAGFGILFGMFIISIGILFDA